MKVCTQFNIGDIVYFIYINNNIINFHKGKIMALKVESTKPDKVDVTYDIEATVAPHNKKEYFANIKEEEIGRNIDEINICLINQVKHSFNKIKSFI
jgi:hypothetical protein